MPEGDTVFVAASRLHAALAGKAIEKSDFRVPRLATVDLSGRVLNEVEARGKHLLFRISGGVTLHTHHKMEGSWHLYRTGEAWRGPAFQVRAVLYTARWVAVGFRLAVVELVDTANEVAIVGHLGPDPLHETWDPRSAVAGLAAQPDTAIGEILLDQRIIAGAGNVYKSEVCFLCGVDPWTPVREVEDLAGLVDLLARLMRANRSTGTQVTTGDLRSGRQRWVYGRSGEACLRCGTTIRRSEQKRSDHSRVTYWCPTCQPSPGRPASVGRGVIDRTV